MDNRSAAPEGTSGPCCISVVNSYCAAVPGKNVTDITHPLWRILKEAFPGRAFLQPASINGRPPAQDKVGRNRQDPIPRAPPWIFAEWEVPWPDRHPVAP